MELCSVLGDIELRGDLLVSCALRQQSEDLLFSGRERFVKPLDFVVARAGVAREKLFQEIRSDCCEVLGDRFDCCRDLERGRVAR